MKTKQTKQREAQERQAIWNSLSTAEKIDRIRARPGKSKRQLARLHDEVRHN